MPPNPRQGQQNKITSPPNTVTQPNKVNWKQVTFSTYQTDDQRNRFRYSCLQAKAFLEESQQARVAHRHGNSEASVTLVAQAGAGVRWEVGGPRSVSLGPLHTPRQHSHAQDPLFSTSDLLASTRRWLPPGLGTSGCGGHEVRH